jgi:hypothetical protein
MKLRSTALAAPLLALLLPGALFAEGRRVEPLAGIRIRQEYMPNVYYFDENEKDRNWIRWRTRAGMFLEMEDEYEFELRFVNEFRKTYTPGRDVDWDEIVIDRLLFRWTRGEAEPLTVTIGRQDIIWNEGFLVLDGNPLDGSRSIYHNALRFLLERGEHAWDLALIANPKVDPIVIAGDDDRPLSEADERAVAFRWYSRRLLQFSLVVKGEKDPDGERPAYTGWTFGARKIARFSDARRALGEVALQHRSSAGDAGFAWAGNFKYEGRYGEKTGAYLGFYYYSGEGGGMKGFRSPWGRWPKWGEMWVYSLIGEAGVSEWQNLAAPYMGIDHRPVDAVLLHAMIQIPYAPEPSWNDRGLMTIIGVNATLAKNLTSHLLWEWHTSPQYPGEAEQNAHFLRWQFNYDFGG